jgi:hypothetical protein
LFCRLLCHMHAIAWSVLGQPGSVNKL